MPVPLQLEPSSWDAFVELLLYHMYHDQLPEGVSAAQVLEAARLADRFQVRAMLLLLLLPLQAGLHHQLRILHPG